MEVSYTRKGRFYFLWKLSWLFGQHHADASIAFEELTANPEEVLLNLLSKIGWRETPNLANISDMLSAPDPNAWKSYADEQWFSEHESHCEQILSRFFDRCCSARSLQ